LPHLRQEVSPSNLTSKRSHEPDANTASGVFLRFMLLNFNSRLGEDLTNQNEIRGADFFETQPGVRFSQNPRPSGSRQAMCPNVMFA